MKIVGKTFFLFLVGLGCVVGWHSRARIAVFIQEKIGQMRSGDEALTPGPETLIVNDATEQDEHSLVPLKADDLTLQKLKELRDAFNGTPTTSTDPDDGLDLAIRVD